MTNKAPPAQPFVITLAGEFDIYSADALVQALAPANDRADVVVDLTAVRYLDSTALTAFIRMRKRRTIANLGPCRLVGLNANLRRLFSVTHLDEVWPIHDTLEQAVESFKIAS